MRGRSRVMSPRNRRARSLFHRGRGRRCSGGERHRQMWIVVMTVGAGRYCSVEAWCWWRGEEYRQERHLHGHLN